MSGTPAERLSEYVRAFETLDPDAVVPFYHLPCTFIAPQNLMVVQDLDAARAVVSYLIEQAKRQGYRRSEIRHLTSKRLARDLASLTGVFVRFNETDEEIARFGFTYIVRHVEGVWMLAVAMAHDVTPGEG